jgi:hypothetical protein
MRGSLLSRKPSFLRASGSLCNDGPSALKSKGTVLKNDVNVFSICIEIKFIATLQIIIDLTPSFQELTHQTTYSNWIAG